MLLPLILKHLLFFAIGILQDILITYYFQTIAKDQPWKAAGLSSTVTLVNLVVLYQILVGLEEQVLSVILVYALGNGVGTLIVMKKNQIRKFLKR